MRLLVALSLIMIIAVSGCIDSEPYVVPPDDRTQLTSEIVEKLVEGNHTILTSIPENLKIQKDVNIPFKIGVKKPDEMVDYDIFSICLGKSGVNQCTDPDPNAETSVDESGITFMFPRSAKITTGGGIEIMTARINIPAATTNDVYAYSFYVCAVESAEDSCLVSESIDSTDVKIEITG